MKIIFSTHYDGNVFLGDAPKVMGELFVGPMGLLDQLELRAGIHMTSKSEVEREADYLNAINKFLCERSAGEKTLFFEGAFAVDPIGVAGKLLAWRDSLVMAGWDRTCTDATCTKLQALAAIEPNFVSKGACDRWRIVRDTYREKNVLPGVVDEIRIDCPCSEIPALIKSTLDAIIKQGVNVTWAVNNVEQDLNVDNIELLEFDDLNDAYEWISQVKDLPKNTVVINRDNIRLNHTLHTWDKPLVQASLQQSNPQILQLFKLSMSVFSRPLNIHNLVAYLQLPLGPIPEGLRWRLAKLLLSKGGFGDTKQREDEKERDDWDEAIRTYEFTNNEGKPTPQARSKKMTFLKPIRTDYSNGIDKTVLNDYATEIRKWILGFNADQDLAPERREQLHQLSDLFASFTTALSSQPNTLSHDQLNKLLTCIYRPMNYTLHQPEHGSMNVIEDIRSMVTAADTLIWLDCQADDIEQDPYDFLSANERDYLCKNGALIPDFSTHLLIVRHECIRLLNQVGQRIVLVQSAYDGTTRLSEHPLIAEGKFLNPNIMSADSTKLFCMTPVQTKQVKVDTFKPELCYELGKVAYPGRKESNTSIETLINFPFNYVMQYVAKMPDPDDEQLKSLYVTKGLVAHHFFQYIIMDSDKEFDRMRQLLEREFDKRLDAAINATGLIMLLPENAVDLDNFRWQLHESMSTLIDLIQALNLTPVGCELSFPEDKNEALNLKGIGGFGARIDFLMLNTEGHYVIIDFKWSYSKSFAEKLVNDLAIQLELYRQTVETAYPDNQVDGVGYYLMPRRQFLTSDFDALPGSNVIVHYDKPANALTLKEKIQNSYRFRMEEIRKGHIEEAETMDVISDEQGYIMNTNKGLCPLPTKDIKENKMVIGIAKESERVFRDKAKKFFNKDNQEPYEIATSHAILKGRLK